MLSGSEKRGGQKGIQRVEFLSNKLLSITNLNHGLDILELAQKKKSWIGFEIFLRKFAVAVVLMKMQKKKLLTIFFFSKLCWVKKKEKIKISIDFQTRVRVAIGKGITNKILNNQNLKNEIRIE